jgi:predicted O-linked N-acetylglucosamine transferase (SPINDLY family)
MDDELQQALDQGHWTRAENLVRPRLEATPDDTDACLILGHVLIMTRRQRHAILLFQDFIRRQPQALQVHKNLIVAQVQVGDVAAAFTTVKHLISTFPQDPDIHLQMGALLQNAGRPDLAAASYRQAVELSPQDLRLRRGLMLLYYNLRDETNALEQALILRDVPGGADDLEALAVRLQLLTQHSRWSEAQQDVTRLHALRAAVLADPEKGYGIGNLVMFFLDDPQMLSHLNRRPPPAARPLPPVTTPNTPSDAPLRIGYLSSDLHNHPVAQMLVEILAYQRHAGHEIHLLSTGEGDDSPVAKAIRQTATAYHSYFTDDDRTAALKIRQLRLDVLIDLNGTTGRCRPDILALRPCPRQFLWLGCPISTGYQHYDGFLVDHVVAPPGCETWCTEPLVRLPGCYHPISPGFVGDAPVVPDREGWELSPGAVLVGVIATNNRVTPDFIKGLVETVAPFHHVVLALRCAESARPAVIAQCAGWGLQAERLRFMGRLPERRDYLARLAAIDVVVDTSPYGAHSTLGECLSLGVPVIVMSGMSIYSRVGTSMVSAMGLPEAIATSIQDQWHKTQDLLSNPKVLAAWKAKFQAAKGNSTVLNQVLAMHIVAECRKNPLPPNARPPVCDGGVWRAHDAMSG